MRPIFFILVSLVLATPAGAQETALLETFLAMSPQELETVQVQLDYLGSSHVLMRHLIFSAQPQPGDAATETVVAVSVEELQGLIRNVRSALNIKRAQPEDPWVSVTITSPQTEAAKNFEATLYRFQAEEFFVLMRGSLHADPKDITLLEGQANIDAMRELQSWGCAVGLIPEGIPAKDVTNQVHVTTSGLRLNSSTRRFESTAILTNASGQPIQGPIALVVIPLVPNVSLANAHGTICVTSRVGGEFINVPMPSQLFAPGETLEVTLQFEHEAGMPIQFTTKVLAGVGER